MIHGYDSQVNRRRQIVLLNVLADIDTHTSGVFIRRIETILYEDDGICAIKLRESLLDQLIERKWTI